MAKFPKRNKQNIKEILKEIFFITLRFLNIISMLAFLVYLIMRQIKGG